MQSLCVVFLCVCVFFIALFVLILLITRISSFLNKEDHIFMYLLSMSAHYMQAEKKNVGANIEK